MSLGADLMKLSISAKKETTDPVVAAARQGKVPTLGDVKRSLKACGTIHTLYLLADATSL